MFREMPEGRLMYIKERQAGFIAEAAANRSVVRPKGRTERRFIGLHVHLALF
jgi:hypothetical protein